MTQELRNIGIGLGVLGIIFLGSSAYDTGLFGLIPRSLEQHARAVIAACAKESYPPSCYDVEIPKLMDQGLSMEEAFEVTRLIQNTVHDYFYCHVLGHNLSAKETLKDPLAWTDVVARCPAGMCSNGCLHGAAQERFRNDVLSEEQLAEVVPQLAQVCEEGAGRDFTGLEQASCYHSLGHLTMYITGAHIEKSVEICDQIAKKEKNDYTQTCYEGAYMQIFQPLEPEDFALVKDIPVATQEESQVFCDTFTGERRAACYRQSWPLYRDSLRDLTGIETFCSFVDDPYAIQRCYNGVFYVLTAQFTFDKEKIIQMCESVPERRMGQCYANAASRFMETDYRLIPDALNICEKAEERGVGERCYNELLFYSSFNFHAGSPEVQELCRQLPEPWQTKCVNGEGGSVHATQDDY